MTRALALALLAVAASSCARAPVPIQLVFPSQETFFNTESGRVVAVPIDGSDLDQCSRMLAAAGTESLIEAAELDSGTQPVCNFRDGGVSFDVVSPGPKAFVALMTTDNTLFLLGCTIAEVYPAAEVTLDLFMTRAYRAQADPDPNCGTIEEKCARGCRQ